MNRHDGLTCLMLLTMLTGWLIPIRGLQLVADEKPNPVNSLDSNAIFNEFWETVNNRFYRADFNGVDWSSLRREFSPRVSQAKNPIELSTLLNEMLTRLRTSHTAYYTEEDFEYYVLSDIFSTSPLGETLNKRFPKGYPACTGIGVLTKRIDGEYYVSGVLDGSPADLAGIRRGNRLISVNGQAFHPIKSFMGQEGSEVCVTIQATEDSSSIREVYLVPIEIRPQIAMLEAMRKSMRTITIGRNKIAYVHVWSYAGRQFQDLLTQQLLQGPLGEADALILDIRDGWGGASPEYLNLFNPNVPRLKMTGRSGESSYFETQWRKPVALLVNEGSRSGKEIIAYGFQKNQIGPVIGATTAGAVVAGSPFPIGDSGLLYLAVSGVEVDGQILEGKGVTPDFPIEYPLRYGSENDPQLNKAIDLIRNKLNDNSDR